jgi:hypothetical protein
MYCKFCGSYIGIFNLSYFCDFCSNLRRVVLLYGSEFINDLFLTELGLNITKITPKENEKEKEEKLKIE